MSCQKIRLDFDGLAISGQGFGQLVLDKSQQVALELPGVKAVGCFGDGLFCQRHGAVKVPQAGFLPGLQHQRRGKTGLRGQCCIHCRLIRVDLPLHRVGGGKHRLEIGLGQRVAQLGVGHFVGQLFGFSLRQQ